MCVCRFSFFSLSSIIAPQYDSMQTSRKQSLIITEYMIPLSVVFIRTYYYVHRHTHKYTTHTFSSARMLVCCFVSVDVVLFLFRRRRRLFCLLQFYSLLCSALTLKIISARAHHANIQEGKKMFFEWFAFDCFTSGLCVSLESCGHRTIYRAYIARTCIWSHTYTTRDTYPYLCVTVPLIIYFI